MRQYMCYKTHEMLKKAHKHDCKNIVHRWHNDDKYCKSLSAIRQNRMRRPFLHCDKRRKKLEREFIDTLIERRRCTDVDMRNAVLSLTVEPMLRQVWRASQS